jgi:hypothetical protein
MAEREYGLPLRVAFSGLWLCSDKEGRFKWQPKQLKLDVLPYDDLDFLNVLIALCETGFIKYYQVDGKEYGFIPTFKEHQRITGTEAINESKIPCPPTSYEEGNTKETLRKHFGNTLEVQEREGKGKGREREKEGKGLKEGNSVSEKFPLEKIYLKTWEEYKAILNGKADKISEIVFITWKEFVDFIIANNYHEIFKAKFVNPVDFGVLLVEKNFVHSRWKEVIEKILSTGVTPQQNLFFRIPQFMGHGKVKYDKDISGGYDTGIKDSSIYDQMEK